MENPTLKAVEKDRNTVMLCSATGNPEPGITWLKDFIPVDLTDPRLKVSPQGASDVFFSAKFDGVTIYRFNLFRVDIRGLDFI